MNDYHNNNNHRNSDNNYQASGNYYTQNEAYNYRQSAQNDSQVFQNDDSFSVLQSPNPILENNCDSSFDSTTNGGQFISTNRNIFGAGSGNPPRNKQKMQQHINDNSTMSLNTLVNIQQFEEQHLVEIRIKLEEEMIKNENLESKLRSIEFEHMIKINELNRRVQDLELKNSNLTKQLTDLDKASAKNNLNIQNTNDNNIINSNNDHNKKTQKSSDGTVSQKQEFMIEMEDKLIHYENEILILKQRESDLLGQMNSLKQENLELRLKTERMSFFAQKDSNISNIAGNLNQISPCFRSSGRKTFSMFKPPHPTTPQRQTSGPYHPQSHTSNDNLNKNPTNMVMHQQSPSLMSMHHPANLQKAFQKHQSQQQQQQQQYQYNAQPQRLTFSLQNHQIGGSQASQRVSVISAISQFAQINHENVNLDSVNEIHEARQLILQISAEKESLEDEIQAIKDKAIAKIEEKEFQIIDLIKQHEDYVDQLKRESSKLQLEVQNQNRTEKWKDDQDNQLNVLKDREISQLKQEVQYSEDKYDKLYQKYLEERRQQDNETAFLQDKYQKDMDYYITKINKQKDKMRLLTGEIEKMKNMLLQNQDFKSEIIKEIEDYEIRLREHENEKQQIERDFLYKIDTKNQIIQEKQVRIKQLQDELFRIEDTMKKQQEEDNHQQTQMINDLQDQICSIMSSLNDSKLEIENLQVKNFKQSDQVTELSNKKKTLNEMIQEMQKQKRDIELNYKDKIENLEKKLINSSEQFQQQILSLKMHIDFLENGGFNNGIGFSDQKIRENMQNDIINQEDESGTRISTVQDANYHTGTFHTQSTQGNDTIPQVEQPPTQSLMDELCDDNLSQRFSQFQSPYHGLLRKTNADISPRATNLSQSQFYGYGGYAPYNQYDNDYRNSYMSPHNMSNRPSYIQQRNNLYRESCRPSQILNESPVVGLQELQLQQQLQQVQQQQQIQQLAQQNKYPNIFKIKLSRGSIIDEKKDEQDNNEDEQSSDSDNLNQDMSQVNIVENELEQEEEQFYQQQSMQDRQTFSEVTIQNVQVQVDNQLLEELREQSLKDSLRISELEGILYSRDADIELLNEQIDELNAQLTEKEEILDQFQSQIQLQQKEIEMIQSNKEQMSEGFKSQLESNQKQYKELLTELQTIRKQNLQMKSQALLYNTQLQQAQNSSSQEVIQLKRKLRSLEDQNEELVEQIITQKQQYSQEKNHLRIQLSNVEEQLIQLKLTHAHLTMEKDLVNIKYKESLKQINDLKLLIKKGNYSGGFAFNKNSTQRWNMTLKTTESTGNIKQLETENLSQLNLSFNRNSILESVNGSSGFSSSRKSKAAFDWNLNFK